MEDKLFKSVYAQELLNMAAGDLAAAEGLAGTPTKRHRKANIYYLAQQSIEKALKSVICAQGHPVPLNRNMEFLLDKITCTLPPQSEALVKLTDYDAVFASYQEGLEMITDDDISAILEAAQAVFAWAKLETGRQLSGKAAEP